ncbi:hypothetical protein ACFL5Q_05230 [Planctomycetota bacterium]
MQLHMVTAVLSTGNRCTTPAEPLRAYAIGFRDFQKSMRQQEQEKAPGSIP